MVSLDRVSREALYAFYNATGGADWKVNRGWNSSNNSCDRYGMECMNLSGKVLVVLQLESNGLRGTLPSSLKDVAGLHTIKLKDNSLSGTLPRELGNMQSLEWLDIQKNKFTGSIPSEIRNMSNLQYFDAGHNSFTGQVPLLGNGINVIILQDNQLTGPLPVDICGTDPDINHRPQLTTIDIAMNKLTGSVPPQLGKYCGWLQTLILRHNSLTGRVPSKDLALMNVTLTSLDLSQNQLSGSLMPGLGDLDKLTSLKLDYNKFSGTLPSDLGKLHQLSELYLNDNRFTGSIPQQLGRNPLLYWLMLRNNLITGTVPNELVGIDALSLLDLSNNSLSGTIPQELGNLTRLKQLMLHRNLLVGTLPDSLPRNLSYIDLRSNNLGGVIPDLTYMEHLEYLALSNNSFVGRFPNLSERANVTVFAHGNLLSGAVPDTGPNNASVILAVPGNFLQAKLKPWFNDPLKDKTNLLVESPIVEATTWSSYPVGLIVLAVAVFWILKFKPAKKGSTQEVQRTVTMSRMILASPCIAGVVLIPVFLLGQHMYIDGRLSNYLTATYASGLWLTVAGYIWAACLPLTICVIGKAACVGDDHDGGGFGAKGFVMWLCFIAGSLLCAIPSFCYAYWKVTPVDEWQQKILDYQILPIVTAFVTCGPGHLLKLAEIAPSVLRWYLAVPIPLLLMSAVQVATVVIYSQNCGGEWWSTYTSCNSGATTFDFCGGRIDKYAVGCAVTTHNVCSARWTRPERCTMAVMDTVLPFFLQKMLAASVLSLLQFLIGYAVSKSDDCFQIALIREPLRVTDGVISPLGTFRDEPQPEQPDFVSRAVLRVRCCGCRCFSFDLLQQFDELSTIMNISLFTAIGVSWGSMSPLLAVAALLHIEILSRLHVASRGLHAPRNVTAPLKVSRVYYFISVLMTFGFLVWHLSSTSTSDFRLKVVLSISFLGMLICCAASLCQNRRAPAAESSLREAEAGSYRTGSLCEQSLQSRPTNTFEEPLQPRPATF